MRLTTKSTIAIETKVVPEDLLCRVGRNVLVYQQIEIGLKAVVPFMRRPQRGGQSLDALRAFQRKSRIVTLGTLIRSFSDASTFDPQKFTEHLERIVESRNQLVHHFLQSPNVRLQSEEERHLVRHNLDKEFALASSFRFLVAQIFEELAKHFDRNGKALPGKGKQVRDPK